MEIEYVRTMQLLLITGIVLTRRRAKDLIDFQVITALLIQNPPIILEKYKLNKTVASLQPLGIYYTVGPRVVNTYIIIHTSRQEIWLRNPNISNRYINNVKIQNLV